MGLYDVLDQIIALLRQRKRLTYRLLQREFALDDVTLADLKDELIKGQRLAADENGDVLVWTGDAEPTPSPPLSMRTSAPATAPKPSPFSYTPPYLTDKILTSRRALEGERKQVTVCFVDIKDSTDLIKDLDPEEAQQLLDPAIHIMMDAVHRFEGTVNQVLGDGIMALFGALIAHEDHAARACYAALAMQTAMRQYTEAVRRHQGLELRIRVGLNAGEVVVRTIGNDLHMDYSAVGPTTNLAARMEQTAMPGSIRLSAATLRFVEGLVRVNALGPVPVKGMSAPVEVYELTGASTIRRRLQAAVARGLTTFVGRDTEIEALNHARERAASGHGQIVAAVGEAGVGKSRLVSEFIHAHRTRGWLVLESASVSYGKATPYFPVVDLLKRYVHVEDGDDPRTIRAKVTGHVLTLDDALQETIPALLSLLDALPEDSPFLRLDPPQRRQRTLDGLKRILLRESRVQPLLLGPLGKLLSHLSQSRHHRMRLSGVPRVSLRHLIIVRSLVFEDLHWIDSETQAWLDSLVESLPTARMLLLVNYRPEYQHRWGSKTFYTQLRLDPLPPTRADEFLRALLGDDPSLEPLKTLLIARTEGNPFFLEESVRTLLETQVLAGKVGDYRLARDLPTIQIPATVQAILAARIDRLTQDEKRLLQTAAVIGSDIPLSLLQAIAEMPDASLHPGLTHLQTAEFLYETSLFPERVFTFKHALTHEVAYSSLLQERRRGLHGRILEALEGQTEDRRTEQVERLAHHAWRGEVWDKALTYMRQAGTKAMARSASREAMVCFEQALAAIDHLPERRDLQEQAIDLRLGLRGARLVLSDFKGSLNDLREAERLAQALDDAQRLGRVWLYMAGAFTVTGAYEQATAFAQRALDAALTRQETGLQAHAHNYLGWITYSQGAYTPSRDHCRQARALLEGDLLYERFDEIAFPAVFCRTFLAFCLAELGAFAEGVAMGSEGLHLAEAVDHPVSLAVALWGTGTTYLHQGELRPALALLERSVHICREANLTFHFSSVATALGAAYILHGRVADALPLLEEAVGQAVPMGSRFYHAGTVTTLSDAHLHAGHLEAARTLAEQALDRSHTYNERGSEAYALRLLGAITMHRDPPDVEQAEAHYQHALALADELGMRPLQAHCHRGLGTLYSQTGQAEQARTELSTAIAIYRDMAMTFWLPETEAALADVEVR